MLVKQLIKKLKELPQDLPIGSFQTHDQGYNEGNEYPWTFCEFSPEEFEIIKVVEGDWGWGRENDDDYCESCPEGGLCKACKAKRHRVVVIKEGY
jgi:hypothetical protein